MKYNTLSTSSLSTEGKKSTFTIYTQPDFLNDKMSSSGEEAIIRCELEMAQRALKLQTRRCRQLVAEFTRKLQEKDSQLINERQLRNEQLSRVIRSLLVFESRLKQEQTLLRHELIERDEIINRQKKEIRRLKFTIQFCKTCSQFCTNSNLDSCDSSSEYYMEGWESGSEFASVTDSNLLENSSSSEENSSNKEVKISYEKNKNSNTDSYKRPKKHNIPRRTTGTYFEVLKLRESEPEEENKNMEKTEDTFSVKMDSLHGIRKTPSPSEDKNSSISPNNSIENDSPSEEPQKEPEKEKKILISETITVFDAGETETNENWYASASDGEDENQRDIYRNNPVLECMNQILLQNINDTNNTPPQSPEMDRNIKSKSQKRVKFSDEKQDIIEKQTPSSVSYVDAIEIKKSAEQVDYYETPIQVNTNFYETPQSIYSNDYEQILSKCGGDSIQNWPTNKLKENVQENKINRMTTQKMSLLKNNNLESLEKHYYVDMDTKTPSPTPRQEILKKSKVSRTPPALPPKPANLVSKFKIQSVNSMSKSCENLDTFSVESEPDYCSISELNLPPQKIIISKENTSLYDPISLDGPISSLINKSQEKNNMQAPKQPQVKNERIITNLANIAQISMLKNKSKDNDIPKLPQVSEIIIPDENEEKKIEHISQDNYIKNNSQLLKQRLNSNDKLRGPIIIGSSVSSLISGFNNHMFNEITPRRTKSQERMFSSFERSQSYEKHINTDIQKETPNFEKFDLSQNFEEFNLDDCEIGEDFQSEESIDTKKEEETKTDVKTPIKSNTSVEIVRATNTIQSPQSIQNLQQIQKNLNCQKHITETPKQVAQPNQEPSYEHFLECTGLSSKSILTPSRMLSNHKSMLKPKDIKLRSKFKSAIFEHSGGTIKYWSEPYL